MDDGPLDEQYLTWLYERIGSVDVIRPSRTYWCLMRQLYSKPFLWFVPNDDNRVEDGRELRHEFIHIGKFKKVDQDWLELECSVLELLIGIAKRLSFEAEGSEQRWFWRLLDNLGIAQYNDYVYKKSTANTREIDDILDNLIWRTYKPDGTGGLFPLMDPSEDQRDVEIWYQLCAYILERV